MSTSAHQPPAPIPLTLITGFYGAGKSTLLTALQAHELCSGALVLTADTRGGRFTSDAPSLTLPSISSGTGCLCCTGRGDWMLLLERLLRDRDNQRMPTFDRLLVETTGDADPLAMLMSVIGHPYLSLRFRPAGILAVVDAASAVATLARFPEARRQIALADCIIINIAPDAAVDPVLSTALANVAPNARTCTLNEASTDPAALLSAMEAPSGLRTQQGRGQAYRAALAPRDSRSSAGLTLHETGVRHIAYDNPALLSATELEQFLEGFAEAFGPSILRISGHATARELSCVQIRIDMVQGRLTLSENSENDIPPGLHLNIVAHQISPERVLAYCTSFVAACT